MSDGRAPSSRKLDRIHRGSAILIALVLWTFGILGYVNRLDFFSTQGQPVLGLSSNGLLSTISMVVGAVLIVAAVRGGRSASTTTVVIGTLFLLSGLGNVLVLETDLNLLAFRIPNVIFSLVVGAVLLILGAYGRFTAGLPPDNPYYQERHRDDGDDVVPGQPYPHDHEERVAAEQMAAAERAVAAGGGTSAQRRRVQAMVRLRRHEDRRSAGRTASGDEPSTQANPGRRSQ